MPNAIAEFESILNQNLLPDFCGDPQRRCEVANFVSKSNRVTERDARDFVAAWNAGLMEHQGRGLYRAAKSAASEQFFWEGRNVPGPRSYTLWMEPVITVAALGRLHHVHKWPRHLIGTQSVDWAFDLVATLPAGQSEHIAGEVKKSVKEVEQLVELMLHFARTPDAEVPSAGKPRNAHKKVAALRARQAPIFWAVGPDMFSRIFQVVYHPDGSLDLEPTTDDILRFPEN